MKKIFILGWTIKNYLNTTASDTIEGILQEFKTTKEADWECEEWCTVEAETLKEAKLKYEDSFNEHKEGGRIKGAFSPLLK